MACTVAPRRESKSEPVRPAREIIGKRAQLCANQAAGKAMIDAPSRDANVPNNEIPPEVPFRRAFLNW